jgi:hypothetical protein
MPETSTHRLMIALSPFMDRSCSHMACKEKLPASLRPLPANYAEARAERVFGVLANRLKCTSTLPVQIARSGEGV